DGGWFSRRPISPLDDAFVPESGQNQRAFCRPGHHQPIDAMQSFWESLRTLHDAYGINLVHFYDSFERGRLLRGMWTTLQLAIVCVGLSVLIGIIGAWLQGSRLRVLKALV